MCSLPEESPLGHVSNSESNFKELCGPAAPEESLCCCPSLEALWWNFRPDSFVSSFWKALILNIDLACAVSPNRHGLEDSLGLQALGPRLIVGSDGVRLESIRLGSLIGSGIIKSSASELADYRPSWRSSVTESCSCLLLVDCSCSRASTNSRVALCATMGFRLLVSLCLCFRRAL